MTYGIFECGTENVRKSHEEQGMKALEEWYDGMTKGQRVFVYVVSVGLVAVYLLGLIPLSLLMYLQLGKDARSTR
jgi:hypothetical protein